MSRRKNIRDQLSDQTNTQTMILAQTTNNPIMMKLSTISLLATASAANASLRGGPVARSSNTDFSAVFPAPSSFFMADSIRVGNSTCVAELEQLDEDVDLMAAYDGLHSCEPDVEQGSKTETLDFASCNATATVNKACSCEFVFHLGMKCHPNLTRIRHLADIQPREASQSQSV